jgi:hypothetical protein
MMKYVAFITLGVVLAGCASQGEVAMQMASEDAAACQRLTSGQGPVAYQSCLDRQLTYRRAAAEERQRFGEALQGAGQALQSIGR